MQNACRPKESVGTSAAIETEAPAHDGCAGDMERTAAEPLRRRRRWSCLSVRDPFSEEESEGKSVHFPILHTTCEPHPGMICPDSTYVSATLDENEDLTKRN